MGDPFNRQREEEERQCPSWATREFGQEDLRRHCGSTFRESLQGERRCAQHLEDLPVTPYDSTALPKQSEQIFRSRDEDLGPRGELYRDVTARREHTEICTVVYNTGGNPVRKAASQCHELVATVVAGPQRRKRLQCSVVESPPNVFNDPDDAARTLRDRKTARDLNLRAALESHQELGQSAWQKACVGVDKDEDVATESGENCVEGGRLPASLRLPDQAQSGLDVRPILDDPHCVVRATACHDEDLVQGKP